MHVDLIAWFILLLIPKILVSLLVLGICHPWVNEVQHLSSSIELYHI